MNKLRGDSPSKLFLKYGDSFVMADSEVIGDEKFYFYHLFLDRQQ